MPVSGNTVHRTARVCSMFRAFGRKFQRMKGKRTLRCKALAGCLKHLARIWFYMMREGSGKQGNCALDV